MSRQPVSTEAKTDRAAPVQGLKRHIKILRSVFSHKGVPCSVGTFAVETKDLVLYYGKPGPGEVSRRLDFSNASETDLRILAEYCDPATFGRGNKAVLDNTYRKAGKLDVEHFASWFDPDRCGLMDQLRPLLLEGHRPGVGVRSELYKLNVYGPGSFFKVHKDTPRGDGMFASLVIVLPTRHEGGMLRFKHHGQSLDFDSAKAVTEASAPSIAYAAFFGDIDHEVGVVETGYRVTLTYNLYYITALDKDEEPTPSLANAPYKTSLEDHLRQSLKALVDDPAVLPNSGLLGFGLRHQYTAAVLENKSFLKGSDAILAKVCGDLGLKAGARIVYDDNNAGVSVLLDKEPRVYDSIGDEYLFQILTQECGGLLLDYFDEGDVEPDVKIHWVTGPHHAGVPMHKEHFAAYGNEPWLQTGYWYVCFVVEVNRGGVDSREIGRIRRTEGERGEYDEEDDDEDSDDDEDEDEDEDNDEDNDEGGPVTSG